MAGLRLVSLPCDLFPEEELELSEGMLLPVAVELAEGVEPDSVDEAGVSAKHGGMIIDEAVKRTSIVLRTAISFPLQKMLSLALCSIPAWDRCVV